jgi:hypothetical protein
MTQTSRLREWDDVNALLHPMLFQMQRPSTVLRGELDGGWGWGGARGFSDAMQRLEALARASMKQARQASKQARRDAFGVKLALESSNNSSLHVISISKASRSHRRFL